MKATMEIPDELYRQVKAKSALEGRTIREVAEELFTGYVHPNRSSTDAGSGETRGPGGPLLIEGEPAPSWFGALRDRTRRIEQHDMEAIRASIARGIAAERDP